MTAMQAGPAWTEGWGPRVADPVVADLPSALAGLRPALLRAALFSLISGLLVLVPTAYMLEVYDRVITSRNGMTLLMLLLLVLGAYLVMEWLELVCTSLLEAAGLQLDRQLSARVLRASLQAQLRHEAVTPAQALHDLAQLRGFMASPWMRALLGMPVTLALLAVLLAVHPLLGGAALVGALLQGLITWRTERGMRAWLGRAHPLEQQARALAEQALAQAGVVQVLGMGPALRARWQAQAGQAARWQALAQVHGAGMQALSRLLQLFMSSLLLGLGAWLVLRDALPGGAGMMIIGSVLGARILAPLVQLVVHGRSLTSARQAWARLSRLLERSPLRPPAMPLPPPLGQVQVQDVTAAAPGQAGQPVLRHISFELAPGELLAIVGPSGAGKSSLLRLLTGLWAPLQGVVRLDGVDVARREDLGAHLGYLPQEVELIDGTLAENIARFAAGDPAAIEQAAREAGLHEWIVSLPQGYDTPVGPGGRWLSGGQRQRVGLARALYGRPAWVVLDEPDASLDSAGDQALLQALQGLRQRGAAVAVVTHRRSLLGLCDKVLVLRGGQMLACAPREQVFKPQAAPARRSAAGTPVAAAGSPA